jgi:GntR family transcriptional regulator
VLDARPAVADRRASLALGLSPRARMVMVERLRLVDEHPMSLQRSFLPSRIGEQVLTSDLTETSLSRVLEFKLGVVVVRAREAVSAVRLAAREARELACAPGAPAFESERVSHDAAGQPIVFDRVFIPGDRFRITRDLHYDSVQSPPEDVRGAITS